MLNRPPQVPLAHMINLIYCPDKQKLIVHPRMFLTSKNLPSDLEPRNYLIPDLECLFVFLENRFLDFEVAFLYVLCVLGSSLKPRVQQIVESVFKWII